MPMAMASTSTTLLTLSLILSLSTLSSSLPSSTILDAAEILFTSGFETMALNLELASQTLTPPLTVFAPKDTAFKKLPQLPLSLLRYHLLPHAFSLHSLTSLPSGANIPTLLPSHSLTITSTNPLSLNNVTINTSPIFQHPSLVIFATEDVLNPYFQPPARTPRRGGRDRGGDSTPASAPASAVAACFSEKNTFFSDHSFLCFKEASSVLRKKGCSVIALFLDMQFLTLWGLDRPKLTLFAPVDEVMASHVGNLRDYSAILRHHLVPCRILWRDLVALEDGTLIWTYERGFTLNVTSSGNDVVNVNGVQVIFPEMYYSDWLVVHGVREVLWGSKGREKGSEGEASSFGFDHFGEGNSAEHFHFSVFH